MTFNDAIRAPEPTSTIVRPVQADDAAERLAGRRSPPRPRQLWGTFTIACTIPIALFVGLYMYKIRPGQVVEASIIGGVLTLGATFARRVRRAARRSGHCFNLSAHAA